MLRLSSSSTAGLWLSLLRKNTKITFWTILSLRRCWSFLPRKLFSVSLKPQTLSMRQPAPRCAHPAAELPELQSKTRIILLSQHLRLHIGEKKSGRAFKLTRQRQLRRKKRTWPVKSRGARRRCGALPLRTERTDFYARIILNKGRDWGGGSPCTPACA